MSLPEFTPASQDKSRARSSPSPLISNTPVLTVIPQILAKLVGHWLSNLKIADRAVLDCCRWWLAADNSERMKIDRARDAGLICHGADGDLKNQREDFMQKDHPIFVVRRPGGGSGKVLCFLI